MADKTNAPRLTNQGAPQTMNQTASQDTGQIEVRPTPPSQYRRNCPGCTPRRMTRAEIERYGLDGGGDDA
jgi:hypothetical protein